jgi:hypothetical protein
MQTPPPSWPPEISKKKKKKLETVLAHPYVEAPCVPILLVPTEGSDRHEIWMVHLAPGQRDPDGYRLGKEVFSRSEATNYLRQVSETIREKFGFDPAKE